MAFPSNSILPPLPPSYFRPIRDLSFPPPHFNTRLVSFLFALFHYTAFFISLSLLPHPIPPSSTSRILDQSLTKALTVKKYITPFFTDQYIHSLLNFHNNIYMLSSLCAVPETVYKSTRWTLHGVECISHKNNCKRFLVSFDIYTVPSHNTDLVGHLSVLRRDFTAVRCRNYGQNHTTSAGTPVETLHKLT